MSIDRDCAICLQFLHEPACTRCGHLFCRPCLHAWLAGHTRCPACITPVNVETLRPVGGGDEDAIQRLSCCMCASVLGSLPMQLSNCGHLFCVPCLLPALGLLALHCPRCLTLLDFSEFIWIYGRDPPQPHPPQPRSPQPRPWPWYQMVAIAATCVFLVISHRR